MKKCFDLGKTLLVLIYLTACVEHGFSLMSRVQSNWSHLMIGMLPLAGSR